MDTLGIGSQTWNIAGGLGPELNSQHKLGTGPPHPQLMRWGGTRTSQGGQASHAALPGVRARAEVRGGEGRLGLYPGPGVREGQGGGCREFGPNRHGWAGGSRGSRALPRVRPCPGTMEGHGGAPRGYSGESQGLRGQARLTLPSLLPIVRPGRPEGSWGRTSHLTENQVTAEGWPPLPAPHRQLHTSACHLPAEASCLGG